MSKIYVLDIGTRSVVGLVLTKEDKQYTLLDLIIKEHDERAMVDGQIHDVMAVSNIINKIKKDLETKHGPIQKVCVAAAGRALKTIKEKVTVDINNKPLLNRQDILHLELQGVQKAQFNLAKDGAKGQTNDFCVGYSVLHYFLDHEEIGNLIDQQGETASVEIIATFLPKVVVESLMSALHRANLEMEALTLEPIAAINVLIPPSMRRLNVALVDIGAGTSDIAITADGTVTAYGMVPYAGDEITESLSDALLLDFPDAEKVKRSLQQETVTFTDILGFNQTMNTQEVISAIEPAIDQLAIHIREEIIRLNQKAPQAVMLIGGGSLTPNLSTVLATKLGLPNNRVAIRGIDAIANIHLPDDLTKGPELVTPLGIAIAANENPVEYISAYVNQRAVRLFDVKALTVGDCLLASGIEMGQLYGKPGMGLVFSYNGKMKSVRGEQGEPPTLTKNGEPTTFDAPIQNGDQIQALKGKNGADASVKISDIITETPILDIKINGKAYSLKASITRNGTKVNSASLIDDRDTIQLTLPKTIGEAFVTLNINHHEKQKEGTKIYLNREQITLPSDDRVLLKNNKPATLLTAIEQGDHIQYSESNHHDLTIRSLLDLKNINYQKTCDILFNGQPITLVKSKATILLNGEKTTLDTSIKNDDHIDYMLLPQTDEPFIFQDVFRHVDINLESNKGKTFVLLINGEEATFNSPIKPHDDLQLKWVPIAYK